MKEDELKTKTEVAVRVTEVTGQLTFRQAIDVLSTIVLVTPDAAVSTALRNVRDSLNRGLTRYVEDVVNLEESLYKEVLALETERAAVTDRDKLIETLRMQVEVAQACTRHRSDELEDMTQQRNREQIKVEEKDDEIRQRKQEFDFETTRLRNLLHTTQNVLNASEQQTYALSQRLNKIEIWAKRKNLRLPKGPKTT